MAFKLTYTDGQADDYDDSTAWEVDDGVLKMGRESGKWTVLVSPSHWATIEVRQEKGDREDQDKDKERKKDKSQSEDKDKGKDRDRDEVDDEDDEDDKDKSKGRDDNDDDEEDEK